MKIGVLLRNMGPASTRQTIAEAARAADAAPAIADLWVTDHIAIPPDDAEGSGGRYLDPLATLAFVAGQTTRIGLGTSVLVLPYRAPLVTAKWIATVHELSGCRLLLGVGVGWMQAEFRALGADFRRRGKLSDETLELIERCFASDVVEQNGQPFLFLPRPARPPLFIGGSPPHAFRRARRFRAGWMPMGLAPDALAPLAAELRARVQEDGGDPPEIAVLTTLALCDAPAARDVLARYEAAGATRVIHAQRYTDASEFRKVLDRLVEVAG